MAAAFEFAAFDPTAFDASSLIVEVGALALAITAGGDIALRRVLTLAVAPTAVVTSPGIVAMGHRRTLAVSSASLSVSAAGGISMVRTTRYGVTPAAIRITLGAITMRRVRGIRLGVCEMAITGLPVDLRAKLRMKVTKAAMAITRSSIDVSLFMASTKPILVGDRSALFKPAKRLRAIASPSRTIA